MPAAQILDEQMRCSSENRSDSYWETLEFIFIATMGCRKM